MPALPASDDPARRAVLVSVGSAALFALMAVGVKMLAGRVPAAQVASVRFGAGLALVVALALSRHVRLRPTRWRWLVVRGLAGGVAVILYFACVQRVGVGLATLLANTAPVWSLLFAWTLLGERPRSRSLVALAVTLGGVLLIVGDAGSLRGGTWMGLGVLSAVVSGLAVTSVRAARRTQIAVADGAPALPPESAFTVFASFTGIGFLATLPGALGSWTTPSPGDWGWLALVASASIAGQLAMTEALGHVTVVVSGIIHELTVVLTLGAGWLLFGEVLTSTSACGALVTILGVIWAIGAGGKGTPLPASGATPHAVVPKAR